MAIEPDTKDWTWVLSDPCPECGFDPTAFDARRLPELIHENTRGWYESVFREPDVAVRPAANIWSPLEYACHVRDVHVLFAERVRLMRDQDDPQFANWDQDATAVESRYAEQDPETVETELIEASAEMAALFASILDTEWQRVGRRSNGSVFTIETLGIYYLHDIVHHLHDVGGPVTGAPAAS